MTKKLKIKGCSQCPYITYIPTIGSYFCKKSNTELAMNDVQLDIFPEHCKLEDWGDNSKKIIEVNNLLKFIKTLPKKYRRVRCYFDNNCIECEFKSWRGYLSVYFKGNNVEYRGCSQFISFKNLHCTDFKEITDKLNILLSD